MQPTKLAGGIPLIIERPPLHPAWRYVKGKSTREGYKECAQLMHMAYPIRDIYTFELFNSVTEFTDSLENNQWKRYNPNKKVKIKGKQTLGIRLQNQGKRGIFVKLDFQITKM